MEVHAIDSIRATIRANIDANSEFDAASVIMNGLATVVAVVLQLGFGVDLQCGHVSWMKSINFRNFLPESSLELRKLPKTFDHCLSLPRGTECPQASRSVLSLQTRIP